MRVITGEYRGRRLETPKDDSVRPTTDKVKEAVFSMLAFEVPDAVFVDLFAGTGGIGIEALSRGAKRCYFGDKSRDSIALVRRNVKHCGAEERAVILQGEYQKVLSMIREKVDLFFLDPPYRAGLLADCAMQIERLGLLREGGLIVCEHGKEETLPEEMAGFSRLKERKYGAIIISIYG